MKGTTNPGLLYKKSQDYKLVGLCDYDYARDKIERKNTNWNCQFIGENLISRASKGQPLLHCLQQKHNTFQMQVVAHNCYGWLIS